MRRRSRKHQFTPAESIVSTTGEVCEDRKMLSATNGLEAVLTGADGALGEAEFKIKEGIRSFEVSVLRGAAGSYRVTVDGIDVGQIQVPASGLGEMELTDDPRDADEFPFPANWPGVQSGSAVELVGLASGTVAQKGNDDAVVLNLIASLSGSGPELGKAEFEVELEHGIEEREFELQAYNLPANTTVPILVNGVAVGTAESGPLGSIRLKYSDKVRLDAVPFPANFPDVIVGTTVQLGGGTGGTFETRQADGGGVGAGDHLRIELTGTTTATGLASFESLPTAGGAAAQEEFKVEVWNAAAGDSLAVLVGGVNVGQIVVDSRGYGKLDFETGDDRKPFPGNWPGIQDGSVVQVGTVLTGVFSGSGRLADPTNQNSDDAYRLDRTLGLRTTGNLFENFGGRGEKWVRAKDNAWYFITPDGAFYRWDGGAGASGELVTILDPAFHANPILLHEARSIRNLNLDDDLLSASAAELQNELLLRSSASEFEDWGGLGEKWIRGGSDDWYFVTPDGALTKWDGSGRAKGAFVGTFDTRFHEDTSLLTDAVTRLTDASAAFSLDRGLVLSAPPNDFFNWGGRQEKWLLGDHDWYFITPDGSFHEWNRSAGANGKKLATLATEYYDDTSRLTTADPVGSQAAQSVLDDVFVDLPSLF
jgi:hypothetical protein